MNRLEYDTKLVTKIINSKSLLDLQQFEDRFKRLKQDTHIEEDLPVSRLPEVEEELRELQEMHRKYEEYDRIVNSWSSVDRKTSELEIQELNREIQELRKEISDLDAQHMAKKEKITNEKTRNMH